MYLADDHHQVLLDLGLLDLVDADDPVIGFRNDGSIGFVNAAWFRMGFAIGDLPPTSHVPVGRDPATPALLETYRALFRRYGDGRGHLPHRRPTVRSHPLGVLLIHERVHAPVDLSGGPHPTAEDGEAA